MSCGQGAHLNVKKVSRWLTFSLSGIRCQNARYACHARHGVRCMCIATVGSDEAPAQVKRAAEAGVAYTGADAPDTLQHTAPWMMKPMPDGKKQTGKAIQKTKKPHNKAKRERI